MNLNPSRIMDARIAERLGIDKYWKIMQTVHTVDVSADAGFQRLFNGYYLIRRNQEWRRYYYSLFESMKTKNPSFQDIVTVLYRKTGNIEASFSSKMLATLNPMQPIRDSQVLQSLQLQLSGKSKADMLQNAIVLYERIVDWYAVNLNTATSLECFAVFDRTMPKYTQISNVKKLDFFLWSSQSECHVDTLPKS